MNKYIKKHTFKEQLEHALLVKPSNVNMWVTEIGNPNANHQELIEMYIYFLDLCDMFQVKAWMLFGNLIGYIRHGGIIPWEWDMDVGVSTEDYQKLLHHPFQSEKWEFSFYADPPTLNYKGYPGETFCFRNKQKPMMLVDICEYKEIDATLVPQLPEGYDPGDYDSYPVAEIYPLQRITLLGFGAWIPRNPDIVLKWYGDISWYDPAPFILTKLFNPDYCELLCSNATVSIPEANSIQEGIQKYAHNGFSFIVRNLERIDLDLEDCSMLIDGYSANGEGVVGMQVSAMHKKWRNDTLEYNFVDSRAPGITSLQNSELGTLVNEDDLMLVMSNNGAYTPFHIDEVIPRKNIHSPSEASMLPGGAGWMYLSEGQKLWHLIHPRYLDHLFNPKSRKLNDLPMNELLYINNHALWGHIEVGEIFAGDFIYFSPGYMHRVKTYQKSYGIGGYLDFEGNKRYQELALEKLKNAGVDTDEYPGVWIV